LPNESFNQTAKKSGDFTVTSMAREKGDVLQIIRFFTENWFKCIKTDNLKYVPFTCQMGFFYRLVGAG
jgi:hypothetical protein